MTPPTTPRHHGLDGLRGLAVVAVLLYHSGFAWARGGYLGVSVFFTLSGYLITTLLLDEYDRGGRIDLVAFWRRRFRRLLPAALVALSGILVFGFTVASASQQRSLRGDVLAALAYVANWRFVLQDLAYGDLFEDPSPVLHFWSLAIEEQYYLVFPLFAAALLGRRGGIRWFGPGLVALLSASIAVSFVLGPGDIDRIYFGTDTRAAEILVGALLALVVRTSRLTPGRPVGPLTLSGPVALLGLVGASSVVEQSSTWLYRGGLIGVAVLSAVTIAALVRPNPLATALGVAPLRWLGLRSYAIYLYHWPIFLWLDAERLGLDGIELFGARAALTFAAAEVSHHLVEMPFRRQRQRRVALIGGPALGGAIVVASLVVGTIAAPPAFDFEQETAAPPTAAPTTLVVLGGALADDLAHAVASTAPSDVHVRAHSAPPCDSQLHEGGGVVDCSTVEADWIEAASHADVVVIVPDVGGALAGDRAALDRVRAAAGDAHVTWMTSPLLTEEGGETGEATADAVQAADTTNDVVRSRAASFGDDLIDVARLAEPPPTTDPPERRVVAFAPDDPTLAELLRSTAARLLDGTTIGGSLRVMVAGDSIAFTIGEGFVAWADALPDVVAWNVGRPGCGLVREGEIRDMGVAPDGCAAWEEDFVDQISRFRPDVVVVESGPWDLASRRLEPSGPFLAPGDPPLDDLLRSEYRAVVEVLSSQGAAVLWLTTPCFSPEVIAQSEVFDPGRRAAQSAILAELDAELDDLHVVDSDQYLCPGGEFAAVVGGHPDARPDGIHVSVEGSAWLAEQLSPTMQELSRIELQGG